MAKTKDIINLDKDTLESVGIIPLPMPKDEFPALWTQYLSIVESGQLYDMALDELNDLWARVVAMEVWAQSITTDARGKELALEELRRKVFADLLTTVYMDGGMYLRRQNATADKKHDDIVIKIQSARQVKKDSETVVHACGKIAQFLSRTLSSRLEELRNMGRAGA